MVKEILLGENAKRVHSSLRPQPLNLQVCPVIKETQVYTVETIIKIPKNMALQFFRE